jgi:hypothetical protein
MRETCLRHPVAGILEMTFLATGVAVEFCQLLEAARFTMTRVIPVTAEHAMIRVLSAHVSTGDVDDVKSVLTTEVRGPWR